MLKDTLSNKMAQQVISHAVYLATYLHPRNHRSQHLASHQPKVQEFLEAKRKCLDEESEGLEDKFDLLGEFENYKLVCRHAEDGNNEKLQLVLAFKQIFCVPWLLCYEHLFGEIQSGSN